MKLCEDCRWCQYDRAVPRVSVCQNPRTHLPGVVDYVTGQTGLPHPQQCNDARGDWRDSGCGPDARYWEKRRD